MKQLNLCVVVVLSCYLQVAKSCSCILQHPQEYYCNADYVIRAKVLRSQIVTPTAPPPPPETDFDTEDDDFNMTFGHDPSVGGTPEPVYDYYSDYSDGGMDAARVWKVKITNIYKGKELFKRGKEVELWTPVQSATCGIEFLQKGAFHVFAGSYGGHYSDKYNINSCDWVVPWTALTRRQRKGLKSTYRKNCDCEIYSCSDFGVQTCMSIRTGTIFPPEWSLPSNEDNIDSCVIRGYQDYCYLEHSACVLKNGKCRWEMVKDTRQCLEDM